MGGWYPPGVTGNEDYFGPRREYADERECDGTCPWAGKVDVSEWNGGRTTWMCPVCGTEHEDEPYEPDWDAIADAARDEAWMES